ncbi:conserved unknown protein [Ectocarpus siliculosus]|uniref:Uncharacterized protein n=1 Tax=Ectocarpus siliculosus TaxID=2880 RepID=D7FZG0_ECTSI|nr:conserved unknown protein [Ectocarpus siliculosus]|eukprot:CBJ32777.1 conserved unknown protein [Ectocarpus siliculosus]
MRCSLGRVGLAATAAAVVVCVRGGDADPAAEAATVAARTQGSSSAAASPAESLFESAKAVLECHVCKTSQLTGTVDDCCVDYSTVDTATKSSFMPLLTKLQKRNFFKYFKVNLEKECPFWEEDGQCMMRDCSVCECSPEEIPKPWLEEDERSSAKGAVDVQPGDDCSEQIRKEKACQEHSEAERDFGKVDHSQSSPADDSFNPWSEAADAAVWSLQDEGGEGFEYVNLDLNPEKFTGLSHHQGAWMLERINNLKGYQDNACMEKRILFRLLSGLHSSIMTQIANDYRFDDGTWGPNTKMFVNAVGMHPDRLTNMYFTYVFVLRAIGKARPFLMAYEYDTGNDEDDKMTRQLINELVSAEQEKEAGMVSVDNDMRRDDSVPMCLKGFDEKGLFGDVSGDVVFEAGHEDGSMALKQEFMHKFHNISRIMDCVGCEKCKVKQKGAQVGKRAALAAILALAALGGGAYLLRKRAAAGGGESSSSGGGGEGTGTGTGTTTPSKANGAGNGSGSDSGVRRRQKKAPVSGHED